ncbi:HAMP domain-containing sensor histidine kinase [Achromobacter xylosoxidans]
MRSWPGGRSATWRCPPCAGMPCAASGLSRASPASTTTPGRRWRRITLVGVLASGLAWGLPTAYWLQHVPLPHQMFLIIALLTMGTGAIYAYCIDLPVLYSFLLPYFLPMLLMLTALDQTLLTVMGVAGLLYLAVSLTFAHRMHRTQLDSLSLRFENLDLLQRLQNEKMAAERSDLAKSRFLAAASHDLRQPVHALSLFVGVLKGHALPAQSRQLVDSISRAVQALGGLFDGLLNLSRLDAGVVRPQVQPVAIADVLDRLHHEFAPQAQAKSLRLRLRRSRPRSRRTRRCWTASCAT